MNLASGLAVAGHLRRRKQRLRRGHLVHLVGGRAKTSPIVPPAAACRASSSTASISSPSTRRPGAAIRRARDGGGPSLIEVKFMRFYGHFEGDQQTYRGAGEVQKLRETKDCLKQFAARVTAERRHHPGRARSRSTGSRAPSSTTRCAAPRPIPSRRRPTCSPTFTCRIDVPDSCASSRVSFGPRSQSLQRRARREEHRMARKITYQQAITKRWSRR